MIRYEIEKMIFGGDVNVMELSAIWNQKYEEYLGVTLENDTMGEEFNPDYYIQYLTEKFTGLYAL